jgi:hypothetical protein
LRADIEDIVDDLNIYVDALKVAGRQAVPVSYGFTDAGSSFTLLNAVVSNPAFCNTSIGGGQLVILSDSEEV